MVRTCSIVTERIGTFQAGKKEEFQNQPTARGRLSSVARADRQDCLSRTDRSVCPGQTGLSVLHAGIRGGCAPIFRRDPECGSLLPLCVIEAGAAASCRTPDSVRLSSVARADRQDCLSSTDHCSAAVAPDAHRFPEGTALLIRYVCPRWRGR